MGFAAYVGAARCGSGPSVGALSLEEAILETYADQGLYSLGIYNCRPIAGTRTLSVHAEGRALDVGCVGADGGAAHDLCSRLLRCGDGVLQQILFDGMAYSLEHPAGHDFDGANPHTDHLHIELSWPAARGEIPLELDLGDTSEEDRMLGWIVAWRGAQWLVATSLTSRVGLSQGADVTALLRLDGGRAYAPAVLSDALMSGMPEV